MKRHTIYIVGILLTMMSCEKEPIPSYIYVSDITLTTKPVTQGSSSENISDIWVYERGRPQGVYEMPVEFPILAEGPTQLIVFAGIKLNGISTTRVAYPFYRSDSILVDLEAVETDTIRPTVSYAKSAVFDLIEGFENGNSFTGLGRVTNNPDNIFEGSASGVMLLDNDIQNTATTSNTFEIPQLTSAAFLELDYKNNHEFQVGITGFLNGQSISVVMLNITPKEAFNKIYVNLTPDVTQLQADSYEIFFRVFPDVPHDEIKIYFDNIKLIHARVN